MIPACRKSTARVPRPVVVLALGLLVAAPAALADGGSRSARASLSGHDGQGASAVPRWHVPGGARTLQSGISMDEAVDRAQKRFNARVVRAEVSEQDGRRVYVLRLLSEGDGRVFVVRVDAETGAMQ